MSAKVDDLRRAYAVLGLRAGAPAGQVRRRFKALARQWHPDRHGGEARNQAEAASRMREINAAYHCLAGHLAGQGPRPTVSGASLAPGGASRDGSMSREQVESLVQALGSDGPIDWLLDGLSQIGGALRWAFVGVVAMACILRVAFRVSSGGTGAVFRDSTLYLILALLALLLLLELTDRRKLLER
jgi:hypothetical protein